MKRFRYTGTHATVFITGGVGEVQPGDTFEVPDDIAEQFSRRDDVKSVRGQSGSGGNGENAG